MITWTAEHILADMVEAMLPTWSGKLGLQFRIKVSVDRLSSDGENDRYGGNSVELTFQRPNNFTKVFARVGPDPFEYPEEWEQLSDHYSCWRSDGLGIITQLYLEALGEQRKLLEKKGKREKDTDFATS